MTRSGSFPFGAVDQATAPLAPRIAAREPLAVRIRVLDAPATPSELRLAQGSCVLGSGAGADVVIAEATVSRAHAELRLVPEGVAVRDLGSSNGIYFHDQRVERMVLGLGGSIRLGAATVVVDADDEALRDRQGYAGTSYGELVGVSTSMRRLFGVLERLEGSLVTVLVEGESGVGKELVARALHAGSSVRDGPFIPLNCGAFARELIASELFGHRKGAFTGAAEEGRGAFEAADGGTLFLDEIGELPLEIQPMLLRALELGEVRPVGEARPRRVKVRVLAATHRDLDEEVEAGRFRHDLFYRLAVVRVRVPALRERPEDIAILSQRFATALGIAPLSSEVIEKLRARSWLGNARELFNALQAYAALGELPAEGRSAASELCAVDLSRPFLAQRDELVDRFTQRYLEALLAQTGGNQRRAAQLSGLNRGYLRRMLGRHGMLEGGGTEEGRDDE